LLGRGAGGFIGAALLGAALVGVVLLGGALAGAVLLGAGLVGVVLLGAALVGAAALGAALAGAAAPGAALPGAATGAAATGSSGRGLLASVATEPPLGSGSRPSLGAARYRPQMSGIGYSAPYVTLGRQQVASCGSRRRPVVAAGP
jgi:hypothetical protein